MKLFIHKFWSGFIEKTNPVHVGFFQDLFKLIFNEDIKISDSVQDSDILLETVFSYDTKLFEKKWKYSFLFSGESRLNHYANQYTCILWGERNYTNHINIPLFVPYLYCNDFVQTMQNPSQITIIPPKNICAIISNPNGNERNKILNAIEKRIPIHYAGNWKKNVPRIVHEYNTPEYKEAISQYKFIISMENSREDTYITEKIANGLFANTIPIYWGSLQVEKYFNPERFINIKETDDILLEQTITYIETLCNNPDEYLKIINKPNFTNNKLDRTIDAVARDIRNFIFPRTYSTIDQIYIISSLEFEPERYARLCTLFYETLQFSKDNVKFICPTYKQTITDELMQKSVSSQLVQRLRYQPMKKSEISLFYNYKAVLEDIEKNYKDGNFLIFESDVYAVENTPNLDAFLKFAKSKEQMWDLIHIGFGGEKEILDSPYSMGIMPYRDALSNINTNYIEDITTKTDVTRLIRKYHTRCTDSFLWSYSAIVNFLNHMNTDINYGAPFDYYLTNFFEINNNFKQYWTSTSFFIQGSNYGFEKSTIQND